MTAVPQPSTLAEQILADGGREVKLLVARGLFPLPPNELIPLQMALARSDDPRLADEAREALRTLEPKIAADVIAESADVELMEYFSEPENHPIVLETILRHRRVSAEILGRMAPHLEPELQEILLLRQDIIVEEPAVLDRLEENPQLSSYCQRRVHEYREHLIVSHQPPVIDEQVEVVADELQVEVSDEQVQAAISEAMKSPAEGEKDSITGLTEAQIKTLPVPVRLKLARGAPRSLRAILVKDKNPMVAMGVIQGNTLTESEVELVASNRSVAEEVLNLIAKDRQWSRKYNIVHALIRNPRTSVGLAVRLASRLSPRDLRNLSRDRNVAEAVRATAARLYRIKSV